MKSITNFVAAALLAGAIMPAAASAATLDGADVNAAWNFPSLGSLFTDYGDSVVGAGVEYSNLSVVDLIFFDVDLTDTSITVSFLESFATFTSAFFNGLFITDLNDVFPELEVFSVVANGVEFLASDVFIVSNGFGLSFQDDSFSGGESVTVNFAPAAVPLPAALPLLLVALGGLGFAGRRRKDA